MNVRYFDRAGQPTSLLDWARAFEDIEKKHVAEDRVGSLWVLTIWVGYTHQWDAGRPLIFETVIFSRPKGGVKNSLELYCARYSTEEEAVAGHNKIVEALRSGIPVESLSGEVEK